MKELNFTKMETIYDPLCIYVTEAGNNVFENDIFVK